jgi:hypothetical protein
VSQTASKQAQNKYNINYPNKAIKQGDKARPNPGYEAAADEQKLMGEGLVPGWEQQWVSSGDWGQDFAAATRGFAFRSAAKRSTAFGMCSSRAARMRQQAKLAGPLAGGIQGTHMQGKKTN